MNRIAPQFIVNNVSKSVTFYKSKLGFKIDWMHKETPMFAIISRGDISLMLRQLKQDGFVRPNRIPFITSGWHTKAAEAWDVYIWVDNADELFEEFKNKGVSIIKDLQNTTYGNRDFEIEDIDGYILCFGHENKG